MAENMGSPVEIAIDVHIMKKKEDIIQEKELITRTITAISNFGKRGVIKMKNLQRHGWTKKRGHEKVTSGHLDQWKKIVDQEVEKLQLEGSVHEFCSQPCDSEYLYCHVMPAPRPITFDYNLHVVSTCGKDARKVRSFDEAVGCLTRERKSVIQALPTAGLQTNNNAQVHATTPTLKTVHFKLVSVLQENEQSSLDEEKMTIMLGDELPKLMSALANADGGDILIEDGDGILKLADGEVSEKDQDIITRCLTDFFSRKIWGRRRIAPKRGDHWEVVFPIVGPDRVVFTVRVDAFYGGVFEKEPVAYTLKNEGKTSKEDYGAYEIAQMDFEDWCNAVLKRHTEGEQEIQDATKRLHNIQARASNPVCMSNEMTSYFDITQNPTN
ncbi:uncharacterized protein LOC110982604 [Acanthaster planci]|uniref:Uncharacterized protein LOC110982604 n=1 Tax=Acanthaster planci TaxID=133434 RepID=A0A8B7YVX0_ACAPL|nr:uncharacterized protein LOC110982604 [Acanthaster planci]